MNTTNTFHEDPATPEADLHQSLRDHSQRLSAVNEILTIIQPWND